MKLPKELITITPFSKSLAIALFILLPLVGFLIGMRYQEMTDFDNKDKDNSMIACTQEALLCPDGSSVGRIPPSCEFAPCPDVNLDQAEKCAEYTNLGKTINACATCGNSICEPYETCTASNIGNEVSTADCGLLYCEKDCQN